METKITCPLGSKCEEAKEGYVERCAWYTKLIGTDAQGNDHDEWNCAISILPILQIESAQTNRGVASAIESLRNSQVEGAVATLHTLKGIVDAKVIANK